MECPHPSRSEAKLSVMRLDDYYQTYQLLAAYLAYLDQAAGTADGSNTRTH
jgi:hypothetical protein